MANVFLPNMLAGGLQAYGQAKQAGEFKLLDILEQRRQQAREEAWKKEQFGWEKEKFGLQQKAEAGDRAAQGVYKVLETFRDENAIQTLASNKDMWKPFATYANQAFEAAGYDARLDPNMPSFTPPRLTQ